MNSSSFFSARPWTLAVILVVFGAEAVHAQVVPGSGSASGQMGQVGPSQGSSIIGQPAQGRGSSIIGQPVPGQSGSATGQPSMPGQAVPGQGSLGVTPPSYPGTGSTVYPSSSVGRDVVKDKLDRANREAADIDRDGRISPEEASRIPGGSVPPGAPLGTPLPR